MRGHHSPTTRQTSRPPSAARLSWASTTSRPPAATAPPRCQLGRLLPTLPREQLIVQTKVAPTAEPDGIPGQIRTVPWRTSRLEHVDLLAIHGINNREFLDWTTAPGGCLDGGPQDRNATAACRFTRVFHPCPASDIIREAIATGAFDYVNLHWYCIYQRNWPAIEDATRHDMGVFIISPSDKGGQLYDPPEKLRQLCAPLDPHGVQRPVLPGPPGGAHAERRRRPADRFRRPRRRPRQSRPGR